MTFAKFVLVSALIVITVEEIYGHGRLTDPVNRSSAWREHFNTPKNYNDNENFCGGFSAQEKNGGRCGPCGDNYKDSRPRKNENGGLYGTGTIVKTYKKGEKIQVKVDLSANHLGHFEFAVCPLKGPKDAETEKCFAKNPVKLANGSTKYFPGSKSGQHVINLVLPAGLKCKHCTFRWHYRCGNNWGSCGDGTGRKGCGPQEQFRSCSDISIL